MINWIDKLNSILGVYTPVLNADGTIVSGLSGLDIPYITRAILFILMIYMIFRLFITFLSSNLR